MGEEAADHVGIIGAGNMGGMMALLFQERGCSVSIIDVAKDALAGVSKMASKAKTVEASQIQTFDDMAEFTKSFPSNKPRVIVFSLPHGSTTDSVIDQLEPHLAAGDILLDCGNEWWQDTERRQKRTSSKSFGQGPIDYIGCGVSGGYQAARHGPSMSPGGERAAYDKVEQLLKKFACKSKDGSPCVAYMGKGGAGHHVKCLHNGIEQGILSAVAEVYSILRSALGLSNDQIADVFKSWDEHGGLQGNFLVDLASELPKFKEGDAIQAGQGIVDDIKDKVVQDADDSEGTGFWTMREFGTRHVAAPTLAAAHCLRLISADKAQRSRVSKVMHLAAPSHLPSSVDKDAFIEDLRKALYAATLASFIQGCNIIARANKDQDWGINMADCIKIWRGGCIIQSDALSDLLEPVYAAESDLINLLLEPKVAQELASTYSALKEVVKACIDIDAIVPALSATLEYVKAVAAAELPTNFEEAELDAFGAHSYDTKQERAGEVKKGSHHTEFRPA